MLPFFRKYIKFVIWIIVLSFVIWGAGSFVVSRGSGSSYAGSVFGRNVSITEFQSMLRFYDVLTRFGIITYQRKNPATPTEKGGKVETEKNPADSPKQTAPETTPPTVNEKPSAPPPPPTYEEIRGLAWQSIIFNEETKRMKINISDDEVSQEIMQLFGAEGRSFNPQFYQMWVTNQYRGRPREFEEAVRKHISARKIRENILKDIPEADQDKRWIEWMTKTLGDARFKDYTQNKPVEQ